MGYWLGIASITAMIVYICHNLGLVAKIHEVCEEIFKCSQCTTCWITFAILLLLGCEVLLAFALAIILAYLSNWFGLLWYELSKIYDKLWQRLTNPRSQK